jgi:hypothetical protein
MNDKHSASPAMYKCLFKPCPYESKRESNCKQHMEKAHGWVYVRSKNNGKKGKYAPTGHAPPTPQMSTPGSHIFSAPTPDYSEVQSHEERPEEDPLDFTGLQPLRTSYPPETSNFGEIFGPIDTNFNWNSGVTNSMYPNSNMVESHRTSWDSNVATSSAGASNFEEESLFGSNFDWSNMDHDLASLNIQLATPATSVEHHPGQIYDHHTSISLDQSPPAPSNTSLSPGAHADAMLFTPYSTAANEIHIDEGFDEYTQDLVPRPMRDFNLFDNSGMSNLTADGAMFEDLSALAAGWPAKSDELAQLGMMDDVLRMEE